MSLILKRNGKAVFLLVLTASQKRKNKGITSVSQIQGINAGLPYNALVFSVP
jgi:hypothetical protein